MKSIISAEELKELICKEDLILIDARPGLKSYHKQHLKGAFHLDLNTELSDIKPDFAEGGRHPLPSPAKFSELLSSLGIKKDSYIIVYDQLNGSMTAARLWWMLKAAGLEKVQVLNGGLEAALKERIETDRELKEKNQNSGFSFNAWQLPLTNINEVEKASKSGDKTIVDVRSPERYQGITEPIDTIAGHIPNAINIPFLENLNADGTFLSPEELKKKYETIFKNKSASDMIFHCGSGVTACHSLLALDYAGLEIPNLYVGSWSEWSRNKKTIAKGKE
ncbi:sulfurtransferase [Flavobacteriaceae bacterium Ap0902]|nr:sulfurtransferase [Flavobacteriaceae bacterium Ap0902]